MNPSRYFSIFSSWRNGLKEHFKDWDFELSHFKVLSAGNFDLGLELELLMFQKATLNQ